MDAMIEPLLDNSRNAFFAAIEIHNKPIFPHRYQVCTIILINAWELLLKAYLAGHRPDVKLLHDDGTSKQFDECLGCVKSSLGKAFLVESENIERLYEYRCEYIHFYNENIETVLYSLVTKSVQLYGKFLLTYFQRDISEEINLILLPIGFKPPLSPIDFLSKNSTIKDSSLHVQNFIKKIIISTHTLIESGIEESILYTFSLSVVNENRIKNADIVAAITKESGHEAVAITNILQGVTLSNDENAKVIRVEEDSLFKTVYTQTSDKVYQEAKSRFKDFKMNKKYHEIIKIAKENPNFFKMRYLNVENQKGGKGYFSIAIYDELAKHYQEDILEVKPAINTPNS